ncbi:MAG: transglycosylase SLT domain-containing protein [Bryobacteraceae bacterium]|jgi:soluble lytic murein transglycosylase-like protein
MLPYRAAFAKWLVPILLGCLSGIPGVLAQVAPAPPGSQAPTVTKAPAAPGAPAVVSSPPAAATGKPPPTAAELQRAAIAQQRAAIRKQAETLGLWLMPLEGNQPAGAPEADCDPLDDNLVNPLIEGAAKQQSLDPKLLRAVIGQESGFRPCAVSVKGAQGLMQLMPETAAELGVANPFDPKQNLDGGARYLKQLIEKYKGDLPQALGAYNAGPKTVDESGGVPDVEETREYVDAILANAGLKPADAPAKPGGAAAKPADPAAKPGDSPAKPADASPKPAEPSAKATVTPGSPPAKPVGASAGAPDPSAKPAGAPAKPGGTF